MPPESDPAALVAAARDRNEAYIKAQALGDWQVSQMPSGDLRKALAALEAVLALHQSGRFIVLGAVCREHNQFPNFSITRTEADRVRDCPDCSATVSVSCTCGDPDLERCPHREAIAGVLGKEVTGD